MPTFPIPVFVACVLAFASFRLWHRQTRAGLMVVLLGLCAVQSLVVALSQHYGVWGMRQVQPVFASFIPPVAWFAYQGRAKRSDWVHAIGPVTVIAAVAVAPAMLDILLPLLFAGYGVMILMAARSGADTQPDTLLSSGDLPARIWVVIGGALIASALSDALILGTQIAGYPALRPWIISIFSVGNFLVIGVLGASPHVQTQQDATPPEPTEQPEPDAELWARVQAYMTDYQPYLDPDLTLSRLARKLGVPAKALSSTINLATGGNVSRFVNQARIEAAQAAMLRGETVTGAMLLSGFNTKSNFNREFLRVVGTSPSAWLGSIQP